ncbi:MAG: hypothetical protein EOO02_14845 [Chitinophagaceae bacterium]|nr:MAG: hypothetical protein EOO02_14845 [Chitinophagaceae bacterium]
MVESSDLHDFYIKNSEIFIDGENSLSKNEKFDGIDMMTMYRLSEFKLYLNDFGKVMFGLNNQDVAKFYSNQLPQLFRGSIDSTLKFSMVINNGYGNEIRAVYAYSRYGKGIYMEGDLSKQKLQLTEKSEAYDDQGYINAKFDGSTLDGTWTNAVKTKTFRCIAQRAW